MTDRVGERRNLSLHRSGRSAAVWASTWLVATAVNLAILLSLRHLGVPSEVKGSVALLAQAAATIAPAALAGQTADELPGRCSLDATLAAGGRDDSRRSGSCFRSAPPD